MKVGRDQVCPGVSRWCSVTHFVEHLVCSGCVRGVWIATRDVRDVAGCAREWPGDARSGISTNTLRASISGTGQTMEQAGSGHRVWVAGGLGLICGLMSWAGSGSDFVFFFLFSFNQN